jgi:hypothetical protein
VANMVRLLNFTVGLVLFVVVASPATAATWECEGRCEDGAGTVMLVNAGQCNPTTEFCRAGCDVSAEGGPRPYAACVSQTSGKPIQRRATTVAPTGGKRQRQRHPSENVGKQSLPSSDAE